MAITTPFFHKRTPASWGLRAPEATPIPTPVETAPTVARSNVTLSTSPQPVDAPASGLTLQGVRHMVVGVQTQLQGVVMTQCDSLHVHGQLQGTLQVRVLRVAPGAVCDAAAEVDCADIQGLFTGQLTVRERLTVGSTGHVQGSVRYGQMVVEAGGQLHGDVATQSATHAPYGVPHAAPSVTAASAPVQVPPSAGARSATLPRTPAAPVGRTTRAAGDAAGGAGLRSGTAPAAAHTIQHASHHTSANA